MKFFQRFSIASFGLALLAGATNADACTRFIYETGDGTFITARSMDWFEDLGSDMWAYPRGMQRDGGLGEGSIEWVSLYGSVTLSAYDVGTADGMNEEGLVANLLYLAESDYPEPSGKPTLSIGAWAQYALDNYASVAEAVVALSEEPFDIVAPPFRTEMLRDCTCLFRTPAAIPRFLSILMANWWCIMEQSFG